MAVNKWDKKHSRNIVTAQSKVWALYCDAIQEVVGILGFLPQNLGDAALSLADYPVAQKKVESILKRLKTQLIDKTTTSIREEWALSQTKNDKMLRKAYAKIVSKEVREARNDAAVEQFIKRQTDGLTISDRVWNYTRQFKTEIESGLDICIREGMSAETAAGQMKQWLKYPDKLFRRVRDAHGVLQLSKAAAAFHPGQGVYRSSCKNARRLIATEINTAYRLADYQRWNETPEVVGIEIRLSNNHPVKDICDDLKGRYPKDFRFTGWHPLCRCYAIAILKTDEEADADIEAIGRGEEPSTESVNTVHDVPQVFKNWVNDNRERIGKMRSLPDFLALNEEYVPQIQITKGAAQKAVKAQKFIEQLEG